MTFAGGSLADGQVAATKGTIYTSTAKTIVKSLDFHNTAVTSETVVVYLKRSGSTSRVIARAVLEQDETLKVVTDGETLVMSASDVIEAETTNATSVDYSVTGATE